FVIATGEIGGLALPTRVGLSALAVVALSFVLRRLSLEPLERIRQVADALAAGSDAPRLRLDRGDERDAAARAMNRLAERLGEQIRDAGREAQRLEAVLAELVEGVLVLDLEGRITLANPGFRELFGVWGPVEGRTVIEVLRLPEVDDLLTSARDAAAALVRDVEVRGRGQADRILLAHAAGFPSKGPRVGVLAVFHDVTQVRRVDRVRRDFIANASHELRTPLTAIQGFAETLASTSPLDPEETATYLGVIQRNARRMTTLIDDLMELSRIESDAAPAALDFGPVDVCRVARTQLADLAPRLERAKLEAECLSDSAPPAWTDRHALERILENLLTNAIRYTDAGGRITVEVVPRADRLEVTVADTGIGIPKDVQDRIFERFYRVDAARSRAVGSTGLGLSIVKHLLQSIRGEIRVESEPGQGSRFIVSLPRASGDPEVPAG
ncbi:MAG TPA: ATP-binding protein, partial [Myxococcota bacterium]|nr:ATP-binding protein [Myxococcota bacterium]